MKTLRIECLYCRRKGNLRIFERAGTFIPAVPRGWDATLVVGRILFACSKCKPEGRNIEGARS